MFLDTLEESAKQIGLKVKKDETWVSYNVMIYGKDILLKGAYSSQALKRISRLLKDVNEIHPTLHSQVSTLSTAGLSTTSKGFDCITPYIMCAAETLLSTVREFEGKSLSLTSTVPKGVKGVIHSRNFLSYLLCLGSEIGSYPRVGFLSYLYRGHPDPLTGYLTELRFKSLHLKMPSRLLSWLTERKFERGPGNPELLISNPCSLNIDFGPSLSSTFKTKLEQSLRQFTENRSLKEIFSKTSKTEEEELYKYLVSMDPLLPRLAHEITLNTSVGAKLSFIAKFSNTKTTKILLRSSSDTQDLGRTVERIEVRYLQTLLDLYSKVRRHPRSSQDQVARLCPTILAQDLRNYILTPTSKLVYLGLNIDTTTKELWLTDSAKVKLRTAIAYIPRVRRIDLPKIGGYLAWICYSLRLPMFLVSDVCKRRAEFVQDALNSGLFNKRRKFEKCDAILEIYSDATPFQAAYTVPEWGLVSIIPFEEEKPIYQAEGWAALLALKDIAKDIPPSVQAICFVDNTAVMYALQKGKGVLYDDHVFKELYFTVNKELSRDVTWAYVPTAENPADRPSRTVLL